MQIDHAASVFIGEVFTQDTHIAGKNDQFGLALLKNFCNGRIMRLPGMSGQPPFARIR